MKMKNNMLPLLHSSFLKVFVLPVCLTLGLFSFSARADPLYYQCQNVSFYDLNRNFRANLINTLFAYLASNATCRSGFYKTSVGVVPPNQVHGYFLCRGDVTPDDCGSCVDSAGQEIINKCPQDTRPYIWYDKCMLHYSNETISSNLQIELGNYIYISQNITDQSRFMQLLGDTMDGLVRRALMTDRSGRKFATAQANFTAFQRLYTLAQCRPDLSETDCGACLRQSVEWLPRCCNGNYGGRFFNPSCNVGYATHPFYSIAVSADTTPSPPPPFTIGKSPQHPPPFTIRKSPPRPPPFTVGKSPPPPPPFTIRKSPPPPPPFTIGNSPPPPPPFTTRKSPPPPPFKIEKSPPPPPPFTTGKGPPPPPPFTIGISPPTPPPFTSRISPPPKQPEFDEGKPSLSSNIIVVIAAAIGISMILSTISLCFVIRRSKQNYVAQQNGNNEISSVQSLQFNLATIEAATNNFCDDNKIGQGGFGVVYKGILSNGQQIAVKRLSQSSEQGVDEFKNEIALLAKLQHRNLVQLLGFCLEGAEKILIYEYVPNKSLDYFLFDPDKQTQLDWSRRYKIISGIARGILYLHEDSRLRIIHRDLKASNVLIDEDTNAKISDFGMARIFGNQSQERTSRVVGTLGYMPPEYVIHGQYSVKSDVFSFGVLVLEIISGKKNNSFHQSNSSMNLLIYAWKLWKKNTPLELMDTSIANAYSSAEVLRCIQIGLLCVQEDIDARPNMATIVLMLDSHSVSIEVPKEPPFFGFNRTGPKTQNATHSNQNTRGSLEWSVNEVSITELYPR